MSSRTPSKSKSKKVDSVVISPKVVTPKRRITSPPVKATIPEVSTTPVSDNIPSSDNLMCVYPKVFNPEDIKTIDSYPIKIGGEVKMLHFVNDQDFDLIKHKVMGYTQIDIPQHIKDKLEQGYQVVSRKTGTVMDKVCSPWTILYLKKGKHYIYTSQNGLSQ